MSVWIVVNLDLTIVRLVTRLLEVEILSQDSTLDAGQLCYSSHISPTLLGQSLTLDIPQVR